MDTKHDGGTAFPVKALGLYGMTLRDYFAAKVMQGDWATQSADTGEWTNDADEANLMNRARLYYRMADAMIKAKGETT